MGKSGIPEFARGPDPPSPPGRCGHAGASPPTPDGGFGGHARSSSPPQPGPLRGQFLGKLSKPFAFSDWGMFPPLPPGLSPSEPTSGRVKSGSCRRTTNRKNPLPCCGFQASAHRTCRWSRGFLRPAHPVARPRLAQSAGANAPPGLRNGVGLSPCVSATAPIRPKQRNTRTHRRHPGPPAPPLDTLPTKLYTTFEDANGTNAARTSVPNLPSVMR